MIDRMPSECCAPNDKTTVNKQEFIIEKAKNFRDYLQQYNPEESIKAFISGFDEKMVMPTIITAVVPIVKAGKHEEAVLDLMKKLHVPEDQKEAVRNKIVRYMEMFAKVITS